MTLALRRRPATSALTIEEALRPLAAALVAEAERRAAEIGATTDDAVRDVLEAATREGDRILDQARAEGIEAARRSSTTMLVDAQREARRLVLDVRRRAYDAVRSEALAELARRRQSPEATALRSRLAAGALARLGGDATVTTSDDDCGIVAVLGARRLDLRAPVLVDRALRSLGPTVARSWE